MYSPEATFPQGGINVECFYLTASVSRPPLEMEPAELEGSEPPEGALREPREAYWSSLGGFKETAVFGFEALRPGNTFVGPALIEAEDTTFVVAPEWRFTLDAYHNGVLEKL
jgi:N-methylhydantoinase A/acetophenone carboxylase